MWKNYCYVLINDWDNKTYNGYTNNPARRLRQHNGEISGGARYTTRRRKKDGAVPRNWEFLVLIECPGMTQRQALSLEWYLKHITNGRRRPREYNGANGRLASLPIALGNPKFAGFSFRIRVLDRYYARAVKLILESEEATARLRAQGTSVHLEPMPSDAYGDSHLAPQPDESRFSTQEEEQEGNQEEHVETENEDGGKERQEEEEEEEGDADGIVSAKESENID